MCFLLIQTVPFHIFDTQPGLEPKLKHFNSLAQAARDCLSSENLQYAFSAQVENQYGSIEAGQLY